MAKINSYETKAGTRWEVRYRTPERRTTRKRGFTGLRKAQDFAATVEVEKMSGEYVPPRLGNITVGELGPKWLQNKELRLKPSAYNSLETAWRIHVEPRWGKVRIVDIDLDAVETWVAALGRDHTVRGASVKGKGATVVIRAYGVLAGVLDSAVKGKRLARNPARGVDNLPHKEHKPRVYLGHEQVAVLADNAGKHRTLVLLLAYSGLRWVKRSRSA